MIKRLLIAAGMLLFTPAFATAQDAWDPGVGTATISGSVKFDGKKPRLRPIDMAGADAKCAEAHGGKRLKPVLPLLISALERRSWG